MNKYRIFLVTYWLHAKSAIDLVLLVSGTLYFFFSYDYHLPPQIGTIIFVLMLIHALFNTWAYEYDQRMLLEDRKPNFHMLNPIQQLILNALKMAEYKHITVISHMSGWALLMGNPGKNNSALQELSELDAQEVSANLVELSESGILKIDSYNHGRDPNYVLAALGYELIKQIG